jgi:hypothetical protein
MTAFSRSVTRLNAVVERRLADTLATWNGGQAFGVVFDRAQDGGFMEDAVTAVLHTVSMCVANAPGIAEGSKGLVVGGMTYLVTGPVVPDSGGWATFTVMPVGGA